MRLTIILLSLLLALPALAQEAEGPGLTLAQALDLARRDSSLLNEAKAKLHASEELVAGSRAEQRPTLTAAYNFSQLHDSPYTIMGGEQVTVADSSQTHWELTMRQPLFTGFALSAKQAMAELGLDLQDTELRLARLEVDHRLKTAYYGLMQTEAVVRMAEEAASQLDAHLHDARAFHAQGLIPDNDLLQSQVALANARQAASRARNQATLARSRLNTLLHRELAAPTRLAAVPEDEPRPPTVALAALIDQALDSRPEPQTLRLLLVSNSQAVRLADSSKYPQVNLIGRYQQDGDNPAATTNHYANDHNASVGVEANWQLFEGGKRQAERGRLLFDREALLARQTTITDAIRLEVQAGYLAVGEAAANTGLAREALAQARENQRLVSLRYRESLAASTETLDAQAAQTQAETNYQSALYGYHLALADLERAIGRPLAAEANDAAETPPGPPAQSYKRLPTEDNQAP